MLDIDTQNLPTPDCRETLPGPCPLSSPQFGAYEVIGELGEGGMGRVYKAIDHSLGRFVAIKVLRSADPFEAGRFRGEAELIALLDQPNIVKIFAIETTSDGRPYLVLEFAEGGSLDRELAGHPQEPRRAAEALETLARAVQYAHDKGVIHRDLKPANVLRGKGGILKLTDFGLAKQLEVPSGVTPSGAVMGTPSYMAPEQAAGRVKELGPATDVYGLGAILYEMLTGRPPFRGVNMVDTLEQVRWAEPASPSRLVPRLHRDLATICLKCLQKAPGRRYAAAGELADDLRRWLDGEPIRARTAPAWERTWRHVRRRPWEAATLASAVLLCILLVGGWLYSQKKKTEEAIQQEQVETERRIRDEKELTNHRIREAEKRAAEVLIAAQAENAERLRKQANRSLQALNQIRGLVLEDGPLDRIDGLKPLHDALIAYYDQLMKQEDRAYNPVELADCFVQVGDLFRRTGDKTKARDAYAKAELICRPLVADKPDARRILAIARLKSGRVAFQLGDDTAAEAACREAEVLWKQVRTESGDPDCADRCLAEVFHLQGELRARQRNFVGASESYLAAIAIRKQLAGAGLHLSAAQIAQLPSASRKKTLDHLRDLGRGYGYYGDVLLDNGEAAKADQAYWDSHHIREKVAGVLTACGCNGGDVLDARQQLARSWANFAGVQTRTRALGTARHFAEKAFGGQKELVELSPNTVEYRQDLSRRLNQIAELDLLLGERESGLIDADLVKAQSLPQDDSSGTGGHGRDARSILAASHTLRAMLNADANRSITRKELERAQGLLDELCTERSGISIDPDDLFHLSIATCLAAELDGGGASDARCSKALNLLEQAIVKHRYRGLHPDDIAKLRGFRALKNDARFKEVLAKLR